MNIEYKIIGGVTVVKSREVHEKLSLLDKILAILDIGGISYCPRHKLFYYNYNNILRNPREIWLCPKCYEEKLATAEK